MEKYIDESYIIWLCKECESIIDIVKDKGVYPFGKVGNGRIIRDFICDNCKNSNDYLNEKQQEEGEEENEY